MYNVAMNQHSESDAPPLRDKLFTGRIERRILAWYYRFFGIHEIENSLTLKILFGTLLVSVHQSFYLWIYSDAISTSAYEAGTHLCWPYFQNCGAHYILTALPFGYSQTILYMAFFGVFALIGYLIYKKEWLLAHFFTVLIWVWKFVVMFILTKRFGGNYNYYDTLLLFMLLFIPFKLFFLRLGFVVFYFLASTIKIHSSWILGSYFTTLAAGLPIFGNTLAPLMTNLVIFMQIVGVWFLLSKNKLLQGLALSYFIAFHLYSGIFVGYRYPTAALVTLIVLFGLHRESVPVPLSRKSLAGWIFLGLLFFAQMIPLAIIPGDQKMTLEGNMYGFYMFEANHQCISKIVVHRKDGTLENVETSSGAAYFRCDPYDVWFALKHKCDRSTTIDRVEWTHDHSINGGPYYRIVDVPDACVLNYSPFSHNEWIKLPKDNPVIIGYPRKNHF